MLPSMQAFQETLSSTEQVSFAKGQVGKWRHK